MAQMAEKRCENCGAEIEAFASRLHEELGRLLKIDPKQHEHGYPGAFGAAECIGRIALIEAGGN